MVQVAPPMQHAPVGQLLTVTVTLAQYALWQFVAVFRARAKYVVVDVGAGTLKGEPLPIRLPLQPLRYQSNVAPPLTVAERDMVLGTASAQYAAGLTPAFVGDAGAE